MKSRIFVIILLLFPSLVFAQNNVKPIIDSAIICIDSIDATFDQMPNPYYNYNKKKAVAELFFIAENMPSPGVSIDKIQDILKNNIRINGEDKKLNGEIYLQCIVNCEGIAGDYQIMNCPNGFSEICNNVLAVFSKEVKTWNPGKQRGNTVNVLVKILVKINSGDFEVIVPVK